MHPYLARIRTDPGLCDCRLESTVTILIERPVTFILA